MGGSLIQTIHDFKISVKDYCNNNKLEVVSASMPAFKGLDADKYWAKVLNIFGGWETHNTAIIKF